MTSMRTKGKSTVVWLLMGMVLLGLGGFGMHNFSGGSSADSIGKVGETPIRTSEYLRRVQADIRGFGAQTGQNVTAEMARQMGIPQMAQARLFTEAALADASRRLGLSIGDAEVRRQIFAVDAFKGANGQFDPATYQDVLRREGLDKRQFEHDVRVDAARLMLQRAITGGTRVQPSVVERSTAWLTERRTVGWQEVTAADLPKPVATPDDATLTAWHSANAARFTAPETRTISYLWITPEMLADSVKLDDQALRDLYQQHIAEYQQPERRSVRRLVFPDQASADAAKTRIDKGEADFTAILTERGLNDGDVDLGGQTREQLGTAADAIFALNGPGIVGPVDTPLGPALYAMDAILDPVDISFEEAAPDLRAEAAADAARRQIETEQSKWEDLLAGGATLEDMTKETPLKLGTIAWSAGMEAPNGSIAGYPAFNQHASSVGEKDFPELFALDDGGVFALRLDKVTPPALIPFEQARDKVAADWAAMETRRLLQALADERRLALLADEPAAAGRPADATGSDASAAGVGDTPVGAGAAPSGNAPSTTPAPAPAPAPGPTPGAPPPAAAAAAPMSAEAAPNLTEARDLTRDGAIPDVPPAVVADAFALKAPGDAEVVVADNRVFLIRLEAINPAPADAPETAQVRAQMAERLDDSLQGDLFGYYTYAVQQQAGATVNPSALAAANARLQ